MHAPARGARFALALASRPSACPAFTPLHARSAALSQAHRIIPTACDRAPLHLPLPLTLPLLSRGLHSRCLVRPSHLPATSMTDTTSSLQRRGMASAPQPQSTHDNDAPAAASASTTSVTAAPRLSAGEEGADAEDADADEPPPGSSWWQRWTHERPADPRWSPAWWREMALVCLVFSVTGSSSMYLVRPLLKQGLGVDGTLKDGPWSYRLACVGLIMPAYSVMLVTFGTLAGRHHYFKRVALRMWGRLLPLHKLGIKSKPAPKPRKVRAPATAEGTASSTSSAAK